MIPFGGLALAFSCALAWAGLDAFRKHLGATIAPLPLLVLLHLGLLPVFGIWWAVAGGTITDLGAYAIPGGAALVLQIIANLLFLAAVRASPLSLTIPFLALTPVFATLVGLILLNERPGPAQLGGIPLVVAGALALGSAGAGEGERPKLLQVFARERGAWMMMGVALCWGVSTGLDKRALAHAAVPIHALVQVSGLILVALIWLLIRGRARELIVDRRQLGWLVLATLTGSLALGLQLVTIQYVFVSLLETIKRAVGLTSAVVLGKLIFAEPVTPLKIVAIALMVAGVGLLMLGTSP